MQLYDTLTDLLADVRGRDRHIRFINGEHDESTVTFAELWEQSSALLGSLQARGMRAGDELVIFNKSNESFVVAFWAAILGGIVPVPVAVGISDEMHGVVLSHRNAEGVGVVAGVVEHRELQRVG